MEPNAPNPASRDDVRGRIVAAAAGLLRAEGAGAVTTRAVASAAGVQAPTIYRLFGDKDGLLDAVAEQAMADFGAEKAAAAAAAIDADPVGALRAGWDATIAFGLANPDLFVIMSDPRRGQGSPAVVSGLRVLEERLRRVAAASRLLVREQDAVRLIHAAGTGAVLSMLGEPEETRDPELADRAWDAVASQILVPSSAVDPDPAAAVRAAVLTLRAGPRELAALTPGERAVLDEWLDRVLDQDAEGQSVAPRGESTSSATRSRR